MRLKCEVNVVPRPVAGCRVIMRAGSASQAIITVHRKGFRQSKNAQVNMRISTGNNRNGTKFLLSGNILRLYTRYVEEGKVTIRLVSPAQAIYIYKADPIQLRSFMTVLRMVAKGEEVSKSMFDMLRTTMLILSQREYSLTTSFPPCLHELVVFGCAMKRLDPRILDLRRLRTLSLSHNILTSLPENLGRWTRLSDLNLSFNQLTELPPALYRTCVKDSLSVLTLNNNSLTQLPPQLCEIRGLVELHVRYNKLSALPPTIGSMSCLRTITANGNQITQLPGSLPKLRLEFLGLRGNPIQELQDSVLVSSNLGVPSLVEVTSRFIRKERLAYSEEDLLPHLVRYLNNARQCWCGQYCFQSCAHYLHKCDLSEFSAWNTSGTTTVPVEVFLCSATCLEKFQSNPFAYWR